MAFGEIVPYKENQIPPNSHSKDILSVSAILKLGPYQSFQ
jgi:hypothetical protein